MKASVIKTISKIVELHCMHLKKNLDINQLHIYFYNIKVYVIRICILIEIYF